jgi:protein involved in polysaccharide export with SLBB domain
LVKAGVKCRYKLRIGLAVIIHTWGKPDFSEFLEYKRILTIKLSKGDLYVLIPGWKCGRIAVG